MRIVTSNNNTKIIISRKEWERIGRHQKWLTATFMPAWASTDQKELEKQSKAILDIFRSIGVGRLSIGDSIMNTNIEIMDESVGTFYVQAFMKSEADVPTVTIDKYYESERMQNEYGKVVDVQIDLSNVQSSAKSIRSVIDNMIYSV